MRQVVLDWKTMKVHLWDKIYKRPIISFIGRPLAIIFSKTNRKIPCMDWTCLPHNSYAQILTFHVMIIGGGALGRSWEWSPHKWNSCSNKRHPKELPPCFYHLRTQWEDGHRWTKKKVFSRDWLVPWAYILGLQNYEKCMLVV